MKLKTFAIGAALAVAIFLFAQRHPTPLEQPLFSSVVDLTHAQSADTADGVPSPSSPPPRRSLRVLRSSSRQVHKFSAGTTLDAPAHFAPGRWTVDQIPAERLVRPLIVIDVSAKVRDNPDYRVGVDDIAAWEQNNGRIPPGALVLLRTGWDQRWGSRQRYRNADERGIMHFPGYSLEAARFLVEGRQAVGLGIDTLSVDFGASKEFPVHRYCAEHSVYHVENVANLEVAPPTGALVVVSPAKLEGESGAPARILAMAVKAAADERR